MAKRRVVTPKTTAILGGIRWIHSGFVSDRRASVLADTLVPLVSDSTSIIDIGCGDGRLAGLLRQQLSGTFIAGADIVSRGDISIPRVRYDGLSLPFASESFDTALLIDVLHHAIDPAGALREAARVARTGVVVKDHVRVGRWSAMALAFMDWFGNRPYGTRLEYRYLSWPEWERLFEAIGVEVQHRQVGIAMYSAPFNTIFRPRWQFVVKLAVSKRTTGHAANR